MIADYHLFVNRDLPIVERACTSKAAFISRGEARATMHRGHRPGSQLGAYHCRWCGLWHLGHRRRVH